MIDRDYEDQAMAEIIDAEAAEIDAEKAAMERSIRAWGLLKRARALKFYTYREAATIVVMRLIRRWEGA